MHISKRFFDADQVFFLTIDNKQRIVRVMGEPPGHLTIGSQLVDEDEKHTATNRTKNPQKSISANKKGCLENSSAKMTVSIVVNLVLLLDVCGCYLIWYVVRA